MGKKKRQRRYDFPDWLVRYLKTGEKPGFNEIGTLDIFFEKLLIYGSNGQVVAYGPTFEEISKDYSEEIDRRWQQMYPK